MFYHIYQSINPNIIHCYNIETIGDDLSESEQQKLLEIIGIHKSYTNFNYSDYVEYGPYIAMVSPWCSNALNIIHKCGINKVCRIEKTFLIHNELFNEKMVDKMTQTIYTEPIKTFIIQKEIEKPYLVHDIEQENKEQSLGFDEQDLEYYQDLFKKLDKTPNNVELHDLAQSNSEHSRHWFFNGRFFKDGIEIKDSPMKMIKNTLLKKRESDEEDASLIAFSDNSSAISGFLTKALLPNLDNNKYFINYRNYDFVLTAETHNFPTSVAPFPGAATGTGGRIRDNQSIGRGGLCVGGLAGYSVGNINESNYLEKNVKTLIEASNGASDYGNKFGEPVIGGFCRSFGMTMDDGERIEYVKPIMFSAGIGQMDNKHLLKETIFNDDVLVVRLGGPCYKIGIGGGAASSRDQNTKNMTSDFNAVQRGDPEMENKLNRVIRACIELCERNPILSIHDQGAGGMANVTKEIVHPSGAKINLKNVVMGDHTMSVLEIWISEHQEQDTVLISNKDLELMRMLCQRENLPMAVIGNIDNSGTIKVEYNGEIVVDFNLESILGKDIPRKKYQLEEKTPYLYKNLDNLGKDVFYNFEVLTNVLGSVSVCSKRFLTNKVDRSVTGLIAQQQCCGPLQTPLADYSLTAQSYFNLTGVVTSIGERPIVGLIDSRAMARMSIGEMLTNMMFCKIDDLNNIRCSGNWMWPMKLEGEKNRLHEAIKAMCDCMLDVGIALDGGKDSLSMSYHDSERKQTVKSPGTLVITGYAAVSDIRKRVTPEFKKSGNYVYYLNLSQNKYRLGGSVFYQELNQIGNQCPDFEDVDGFKDAFNKMQDLIDRDVIKAGHDVSDGGLLVSLLEMCFAGNMGFKGELKLDEEALYAEELGVIFEVEEKDVELVNSTFKNCYQIGRLVSDNYFELVMNNGRFLHQIKTLQYCWEKTSYRMELEQTNEKCVKEEYELYRQWMKPDFKYENYTDQLQTSLNSPLKIGINNNPKVAIIREEGSNGDREMAAAFFNVGFDVYDYNMNDFIHNEVKLDDYRGIVFVGGFSYSDVFGAARGWYSVINNNPRIKKEFDRFYQRDDTFSLGICNGCQLMALLGWIPKCQLLENDSGRFESRFSRVKINKSNAIMLKNMEDSVLGIWSAHGEGKFNLNYTVNRIPIQYVDENNKATQVYPHNPNGSDLGIAGLCSENGRHLAMMPHPERCFLEWQKPISIERELLDKESAWTLMFKNAREWCQ